MKKLFFSMIGLFLVYFLLRGILFLFRGNTVYQYEIMKDGNVISVKEQRNRKTDTTEEYYDFEIGLWDKEYTFRLFKDDLSGYQHFIRDIKEVETEKYQCFLPVFRDDQILLDMICEDKDTKVLSPYHNIRLNDTKLDGIVDEEYWDQLEKFSVKEDTVQQEQLKISKKIPQTISKIGMSHYRGLYIIDQDGNVENITLFSSDHYDQVLHAFLDGYYFVANYNESYDFQEIYLVNLKTAKVDTITMPVRISFDSYIQGIVDHRIYIMDRSNRVQYYFDMEDQLMYSCKNKEGMIQYYNGKEFVERNIYDALNEDLYFQDDSLKEEEDQIQKYDARSNYYYLWGKEDDIYHVYRSMDDSFKMKTYLFDTTENSALYQKDGVIYQDGTELYYISNVLGTKKILENRELEFNDTIIYGVI